jgi:hypothetical protein
MLNDALSYPTRGDDGLKTMGIGGVLNLFSFLLLPIPLVFGYYVRVLAATANGDDEPPAFDDWGDLFVTGLKAFLVTFAYYLIPALAFLLLGGLGALTGSRGGALAGMAVAFLVSGVLGVALTYVSPAALANFAATGSVGAAFAFGDIKSIVFSGEYFVAWLLGFVVLVAGGLVIGLLNVVPIFGTIVGAILYFPVVVVAFRMFGTAYRNARGAVGEAPPTMAPA